MIIEDLLHSVVPYVAAVLNSVGLLIIIYASIKALGLFIKNQFDYGDVAVGLELAKGMALSLNFLLAGEIIHTIIIDDLIGYVIVAGIALLRVGLHFVINLEIKHSSQP
jgi:uncharacterized membrane protein